MSKVELMSKFNGSLMTYLFDSIIYNTLNGLALAIYD
jgi:hypothetical protein